MFTKQFRRPRPAVPRKLKVIFVKNSVQTLLDIMEKITDCWEKRDPTFWSDDRRPPLFREIGSSLAENLATILPYVESSHPVNFVSRWIWASNLCSGFRSSGSFAFGQDCIWNTFYNRSRGSGCSCPREYRHSF